MRINVYQKVSLAFLVFLVVFWVLLFNSGSKEGFYNYLYSFLFGLIPLIGGFIAMVKSRMWGGFGSAVGKAVFFIGLGLFCWGFGETIWSYYNFFLGEPAPYPSLADLGFAPSIFFYGLGTVYLAKATGAKYGLRNNFAKVFVALAPIILLGISYYFLVVIARGGVLVPLGETPLKIVLDIAYPLGDFLALTIAVIISGLSFQYLGGKYLYDIISILAGLAVMTVADAVFSYTTTVGTFYNGQFGDLLLTTGLFLLTFGVLGFCSKLKEA
ncbi:MAG: Membrane protein [Microgenomates group bacterium Gr01-1014_7]|nr:MAG: Membrane protein [Microgenomates group bacterium Gr01-1014_7]